MNTLHAAVRPRDAHHVVLSSAFCACLMLSGCVEFSTPPGPDVLDFQLDPVFLLGTELLEPPSVSNARSFKTTVYSPIDSESPSSADAAGFFITVSARNPESLRIRMSPAGVAADFRPAPAPTTAAERSLARTPAPYDDFVRDLLADGHGVFWIDEVRVGGSPLAHRIGCLVPTAALSPITTVSVYSSEFAGVPIGGFEFELVDDFFYQVVIGDSVQWGNGLIEEDKMRALVGNVIERELGRKVITQVYANSGARIVPAEGDGICRLNCFGETPLVSTSVIVQVDLIERPDLIDLILLDGCINDVGVVEIINPLVRESKLIADTEQFCEGEMTTLLRKARDRVPNALVVVTGYYQIVSPFSDLVGVREWSILKDIQTEVDDLIDILSENSIVFRDTAHAGLAAAVATVNDETGETRIAFADPGFGPENAVFAKDKWLWSMTNQGTLLVRLDIAATLFPEDPILRARETACSSPLQKGGLIGCIYASVGHPTPPGERAYANAIIDRLRELGLLQP